MVIAACKVGICKRIENGKRPALEFDGNIERRRFRTKGKHNMKN